jgi:hypothetical protein
MRRGTRADQRRGFAEPAGKASSASTPSWGFALEEIGAVSSLLGRIDLHAFVAGFHQPGGSFAVTVVRPGEHRLPTGRSALRGGGAVDRRLVPFLFTAPRKIESGQHDAYDEHADHDGPEPDLAWAFVCASVGGRALLGAR